MHINYKFLLVLGMLQVKINYGLDTVWMNYIAGMNCTSFLHLSSSNSFSVSREVITVTGVEDTTFAVSAQSTGCPPWHYTQAPNDTICKRGPRLGSIVNFVDRTEQTWLEPFYCMTITTNNTKTGSVVGGCLYSTAVNRRSAYYPLPCNSTELNKFMCDDLNREGQLCGKCKKGFAPPVYSYSLKCVNCTDYSLNWLKYIAVALGPLTVFSFIITVFHISPTSPYLHGFIFYCHITSMPTIIRLVVVANGYAPPSVASQVYISLLGIWNLDFFRLVYNSFCIHPHITVLQALALDYIVAAYPLLLVCIIFFLVSLHSHDCTLVVVMWKPFGCVLRPFLRNLNVQTSLIESFATLYLLSIIKFQTVTLDLLTPTVLYHMDRTHGKELYLYLAGDVEYFGQDHWPYAVLAISAFILIIILPTLLLFLYPCQCFQQCLNRLHCNSHTLRTFMDVFQGHYKDGTNQSRDFRYFSGIYFVGCTVCVAVFALLNSYEALITIGVFLTIFCVTVTMLHPQRTNIHYIVDSFFLLFLALLCLSGAGYILVPYNRTLVSVSLIFLVSAVFLPFLFQTGLFLYWACLRRKIPQGIFRRVYTTIH